MQLRPASEGTEESLLRNEINQSLLSLLRAALVIGLITNFLFGVTDILFEPVHDLRIGALRLVLVGAVIALWIAAQQRQAVRWAVPLSLAALASGCIQAVGPTAMHGDLTTPIVLSLALAAAVSTAAPWGVAGQLAAIVVTIVTTIGSIALATGDLHVALAAYPTTAAAIVFSMSLYGATVCRRSSVLSIERGLALLRSSQTLEAREAQIRDQLVQLDTLYRTAPIGLSLIDRELRFVRINDTLAEMNGVPASAHLGLTLRDILPELADQLEPLYRGIFATGRPVLNNDIAGTTARAPGVMRHWRAGYWPVQDPQGLVVAVSSVVQEITEQKHAQEAIAQLNANLEHRVRERTAQLSALVENTGDAIWSIDSEYRMAVINTVAEQWFRETYGKPLRMDDPLDQRAPADESAIWRPLYDKALAGERLVFEREYPKNGELHSYLISVTPIVTEGNVNGATVFAKDITDLKRAQERVREHQAALSHMLRLHTIGEMAAGLAHEINQPLAAISNYARGCRNRITSGGMPPEQLLPVLEEIATQALRAGEIIRRLRSMVEKREPTRETVNLNSVVTEAVHVVEGQTRQQGVTMNLDLAFGLPAIDMDRIQIEQVIVNLLLNSLEAMPAVDGRARHVTVRTAQRSDHSVEVVVEDSGSGLAPAIAEKMFEPFFTMKAAGLGMGLTISRSIIEAHGGRIWAANNPDCGTQVHVVLPSTAAEH
jgi:PAS domain S-box-containing protein